MTRPELAIDVNGQPFDPPADAVGWRARRIDGRGRPEVVCDTFGRPLFFPLDASFEDVYRAAGPGKYRLIPVDASGHMFEEGPIGATGMMQPQRNVGAEGDPDTAIGSMPGASFQSRDFRDELLIHLITKQTQMAEAVIRGIPAWMTAGAELVAAADGAKITSRQPLLAPPPAEESDIAPEPAEPVSRLPGWLRELVELAVKTVAAQVGEKFAGKLAGGIAGGIPLEALFDWSKAAPKPTAAAGAPSSPEQPSASAAPATEPTWFHGPSGGMRADTGWYAHAPSGPMPAAAAWPAAAPTTHEMAWYESTPSGVIPSETAPAAASSVPAWFAPGPTGISPMAPVWFPAPAAEPAMTSGPTASGVMASASAASAPQPSTAMPGTSRADAARAAMPSAPVISTPIVGAPPSSDSIASAMAPSSPLAPPSMQPLSEPRIPMDPAHVVDMAGTLELNRAEGAPPPPALSSGALSPSAPPPARPMTLVPVAPGVGAPPPEGGAALQLRSARAPRPASSAPTLARRGAMVPTSLSPTPLIGGAPAPQPLPSPLSPRRTSTADSIALPSYIVEIYSALTPQEQERTQQLVAMLTQEERVQWLLELGSLNLPDAIARVRDLIRPHT